MELTACYYHLRKTRLLIFLMARSILAGALLEMGVVAAWADNAQSPPQDNLLGSQLTTGFFFRTNLHLFYNYNFSEIRHGGYGGHEILVHFSRKL